MSPTLPYTDVVGFVVLTGLLSLVTGLAAFEIGGAETFESPRALPLMLLAIWSPNIVAVALAIRRGELRALLEPLTRLGEPGAWVVAMLPLAIAALFAARAGADVATTSVPWLALVLMNVIMGPLGEELGWRGFLLPRLVPSLGLLGAALAVGVVWALWHLPLWCVPSPQRSIPFAVFLGTVVCFSVIMTAAWQAGGRALGPVIAFHLSANVAVGWLEASGALSGSTFYRHALPIYALAALIAAAWLSTVNPQ